MAAVKKRNFAKEVERVLRQLLSAHDGEDLTLGDLTSLALGSGRLDESMLDGVRDKAIARYFGHVLNRASITLADGRKVRAFQNYTKFEQSTDGKEVQQKIWKDINSMTPAQMLIAAKERAKHIRDSRSSLQADIDYWNENVRPKFGGRKIQLHF